MRGVTLLDYTPGGPDFHPELFPAAPTPATHAEFGMNATVDIGGADEVHGETGDDTVYVGGGNDMAYGDAEDDDIIGGWGSDWISGGTGDDGVIGDDGRIFTSRNVGSATPSVATGESLYGVSSFKLTDPSTKDINGDVLNEAIYTPGNVQVATINVGLQLKKTVDLTPWNIDSTGGVGVYLNPAPTASVPKYANDVIYGGLGNDFLHGGAGDDAIGGAEALLMSYTQTYDPSTNALVGEARSDFSRPYNTGDMLRYNVDDPLGWHRDRSRRSGEFALYDEYDPLRKIELITASSNAALVGSAYADQDVLAPGVTLTRRDYFMNFNAYYGSGPSALGEGILRPGGTTPDGVPYSTTYDDGSDRIFGDLGNDWLVGGTGRDDSYGGFGNDLINDDDYQNTDTVDISNKDPINSPYDNQAPDTQPYFEDRAYGGAGRDVLIANTGGDRLIDWVGEFNTFLVPFAPFGTATVSRTLQPQLAEYLYALSRSDGADPTRYSDDTSTDPLRNGEPFGELGLLRQQDTYFHDQTGAPADPQAGNIPGGKRDVLRSATFDNNTPQNLFTDSGSWTVSGGVLQVAATSLHSDAVSVYEVGDRLPTYFEVAARIQTIKPTAGWNANSFVMFDYVSYQDFKFAGIDVSTNKLVIGHRDSTGWIYDKQTPFLAKSDQWYDVLLSINGGAATIVVGTTSLSTTYAARILSGVSYGLNWGLVGFGSNNARGSIDNLAVQILPPQTNIVRTDDFSTAALSMFGTITPTTPSTWVSNPSSGSWTVNAGRYTSTLPSSGTLAFDLMDMSDVQRLSSTSALELSASVRTTAGTTGFVFDRYDNGDFKWAGFDVASKQVVIGHYTNRGGWVVDQSVAFASLAANTDFNVTVMIKASTVSVTVALMNGQAVLASAITSWVFNASAVDGRFGLMAKGGSASFDVVTAKTDDTQVPLQLLAQSSTLASASAVMLSDADLKQLADAALARWSLTQDKALVDALRGVKVQIADLPDTELGEFSNGVITIDANAAGYGWFVDRTPSSDSEFRMIGDGVRSAVGGAAAGHYDLLSALVHEYGHAAGFEHSDGGVMQESLALGVRTAPSLTPWRVASNDWMADSGAMPSAVIDWSAPRVKSDASKATASRQGAVGRDTAILPTAAVRDWRPGFVNGLAAPEWSRLPNSRLVIELPKIDRGSRL